MKIYLALLAFISFPAYAADAPVGAGKYKSKGPIEITSDALEVLQEQNKAIFTGRVLAIQGDVKLKSEKMTVYYTKPAENADAKKAPSAAAPEKNGIDKIDVEGGVFLSTPEETASGDNGIYDVANHKIFLNNNVVLTRGENVLRGDKLIYDFETGRSALNTPDTGVAATQDGQKKRVKALFVPSGDEKLPNKK